MNVLISLVLVCGLFVLGFVGGLLPMTGWLFCVLIPYAAVALFIGGTINRVLGWVRVPVPFRIPTTCGQQKSLPWMKSEPLENPHNGVTAVARMILEVLLFRSLLRNTKAQLVEGRRLVYATDIWLWLGAIVMHYCFLLIVVRHFRLLLNPVPYCITFLEMTDGFLEVGVPVIFVTSVLFILAAGFLLVRRLVSPQLRYISLPADYFPLFLLLGIGISGFCLRHCYKTDIVAVKELAVGLATLKLSGEGFAAVGPVFFGHLMLVSVLLASIPFSKLMHMAGVFFSPTRNLANSNRRVHHTNPWDYPVKVHPYDEYEDELRDKMKAAGLPLDKE